MHLVCTVECWSNQMMGLLLDFFASRPRASHKLKISCPYKVCTANLHAKNVLFLQCFQYFVSMLVRELGAALQKIISNIVTWALECSCPSIMAKTFGVVWKGRNTLNWQSHTMTKALLSSPTAIVWKVSNCKKRPVNVYRVMRIRSLCRLYWCNDVFFCLV